MADWGCGGQGVRTMVRDAWELFGRDLVLWMQIRVGQNLTSQAVKAGGREEAASPA